MSEAGPELDPETLDFLLEYAGHSLDAKTTQLLAAGSVAMGLAGFGGIDTANRATLTLLLAALGCFMVLAAVALRQLWTTEYSITDEADRLWNHHYDKPLAKTKLSLMTAIADAYAANRPLNKWKACWVRCAVIALGLEVGCIGAAIAALAF
jgi:hypothetical protein